MMVHEIQDKRSKKALLGPSTKEGRGLKKSIGRKKVSMHKQLKEMYLWKVIGTGKSIHDSDVQLNDEAIKEMLRTGIAPWSDSEMSGIYWGRVASRCKADLARCHEELPKLRVEKERCRRWVNRTLSAVRTSLLVAGEGSGRGILLKRWEKLLEGLNDELKALKW